MRTRLQGQVLGARVPGTLEVGRHSDRAIMGVDRRDLLDHLQHRMEAVWTREGEMLFDYRYEGQYALAIPQPVAKSAPQLEAGE